MFGLVSRVEAVVEGFSECFEDLEDPRTGNAGRHDLLEILMIALCTVLSGGQTAVDMSIFAREKETFLREFLKLEHGPPSHDTFSRVFRLLDPRWLGDRSTRRAAGRPCTCVFART